MLMIRDEWRPAPQCRDWFRMCYPSVISSNNGIFLSCYFFCLTIKRFGLFSYIVAVGNLSAIYRIRVTIIIRYNPNNIIVGLYLIIIF
jgi:hypothetical protein